MEDNEFSQKLKEALKVKQDWFTAECLPEMLTQYRLVHSCIKNLYELFVRRSVIQDDPYRLDKKIVDIVLPDSSPFMETEMATIFGARLSDYETMLDFICTYFRFSIEAMTLPKIKKLIDFNNCFEWSEVTNGSKSVNTKALASAIETARAGADGVTQNMISDSISKCGQTTAIINKELSELAYYQKELYKYELRNDLIEHPGFKKDKAKESAEAELAEIKRLYTKVMGKKPFYSDLIGEIIKEDHAADRDKLQAAVLKGLEIKEAKKTVKKEKQVEPKTLLMEAVLSIGIVAPIIGQLKSKLQENFELLFAKKSSFIGRLKAALKKAFGIKDKERVVVLPLKDPSSGVERTQKLVVADFLYDLNKKERIYNGIGTKGSEYQKIENSPEDSILMFLSKQISEMQKTFNTINALDNYFKGAVDITTKVRLRGMQMELSTLRQSVIKINKKRGEYVSCKEETEQMKKLGIVDEEE